MQKSVIKLLILSRIANIHSAAKHSHGYTPCLQRCLLTDAVYSPGHTADHHNTPSPQFRSKLRGHIPSVLRAFSGADNGNREDILPGQSALYEYSVG